MDVHESLINFFNEVACVRSFEQLHDVAVDLLCLDQRCNLLLELNGMRCCLLQLIELDQKVLSSYLKRLAEEKLSDIHFEFYQRLQLRL